MSDTIYVTVDSCLRPTPIIITPTESLAFVRSINGYVGSVVLNKNDVGLNNVENVSILDTSGFLQGQINNTSGLSTEFQLNNTGQFLSSGLNGLSNSLEISGSSLLSEITGLSGFFGSNPSGYITGVNTDNFYTKDNPSGYITGVDLSSYVTSGDARLSDERIPTSPGLSSKIHAADSKDTPVDSDEISITDSASSFSLKKLTWTNLKTVLKSYFDNAYSLIGHNHSHNTLSGLQGVGPEYFHLPAGTVDAQVASWNAANSEWVAATASGGGGGASNVFIPASALIPKTTGGCGVNSSETTTNDQNYDSLDFDTATSESADFMVVLPNNWDYGTVTAHFYWTADSGSGTACFGLKGVALADDDAIDTAGGTAQTSTDTLLSAGDMHVSPATSAITIGGTPAANKPVQFTVYRDVANDTLGVDARLLGVEIIYGI